jgi:hypothetical protein
MRNSLKKEVITFGLVQKKPTFLLFLCGFL